MWWLDGWVVRGTLRGLQGWILPPLLSLLLIPGHHSSLRQVNTKYGPVQGVLTQRTDRLQPVATFLGIPFAAPPVGNLRFMPPVTVSPWREVLRADTFGPVCPQNLPEVGNSSNALGRLSFGRIEELKRQRPFLRNQSEDCLYLNVYVPASGEIKTAPIPVLLFIHGDSFQWGSGNLYDGSALAAYGDVVVVTINYRLGVFGFLNVNSGAASGIPSNLGILDQIAALHWIQENIQDFGGDRNSVTVLGQGTGAACLHYLMTSDALPHGLLFHRVILMSGSALSPWARATNPHNTSKGLAAALNCPTSPPHNMVRCLRDTSVRELLNASQSLQSSNRFEVLFGPSYDAIVVHTFKNKVGEYLERMARYDLMLGVTSAEAFVLLNQEEMELGLETEGRNKLVSDFVTATFQHHQKEIFSAILTEYTDWASVSRHPITTRDSTLSALSDGLYVSPAIETADYHASLNKNSWFYVFDYQSKFGPFKTRQGCIHGEELDYVLGLPLQRRSSQRNYTRTEEYLAEMVLTYWSNFITSGNPNFPRDPTKVQPKGNKQRTSSSFDWDPYDPTYKKYLHIGVKTRMKDQFRARQVALWLNLVPDLVRSGQLEFEGRAGVLSEMDEEALEEEYLTYSETLPYIPSIKDLSLSKTSAQAKSYGVMMGDHGMGATHGDKALQAPGVPAATPSVPSNDSYFALAEGSLSSYSTALSVTIAIGTSLLILNILIFAAVYYQRDRNKMGSRYSLSSSGRAQEPVSPHQPSSLSGSVQLSQGRHSRRQSCRMSSYDQHGRSTYLPPPQFADGQHSEGSESAFSMGGGGGMVGVTVATLPRRCHQQSMSDTQPLILGGSSFRTLPRQPPEATKLGYGSVRNSRTDLAQGSSQTLPLKSSLKKSLEPQGSHFPTEEGGGSGGSLEELRV